MALSDELGVKKVLMAMQKKLYSKRSPCGGDLVMKKVTEVSVFKGCSDNITKKGVPVLARFAPPEAI